MPRSARTSAEYQHIVVRGIGKQLIFEDDADRRFYLSLLERYQDQTDVNILAYCLMQNHVHLLIQDSKNETSQFMQKLGISYAQYFNRKYERVGHLFQNRFFNERILSERQLLVTYRYILNNPAKAGMCSAAKYRWSSFHEYGGNIRLTNPSIIEKALGDKQNFISYMNLENDDSCLEVDEDESFDETRQIDSIKRFLGITNFAEISNMTKKERNKKIILLRENGFSIRKIERLTGISRGIIQKAKI